MEENDNLNINNSNTFKIFASKHRMYFDQREKDGDSIEDIIYDLSQRNNVCFYLWQKYGTQFINGMKRVDIL